MSCDEACSCNKRGIDYYGVLSLKKDCDDLEIKAAWVRAYYFMMYIFPPSSSSINPLIFPCCNILTDFWLKNINQLNYSVIIFLIWK